MDLNSVIVGLLAGMIMSRFKILLKTMLSFGTSFMLIKLFHHEVILRPFSEWNWNNLVNGYNFWTESIIYFFGTFFLFYWIIPKLTSMFITNKFEQVFSKRLDDRYSKLYIYTQTKTIIYKVFNLIRKVSWKKIKVNDTKVMYNDFKETLISLFAIIIHLIICSIYFFENHRIVTIIASSLSMIIFLYHLIFIPIYSGVFEMINKHAENEFKE